MPHHAGPALYSHVDGPWVREKSKQVATDDGGSVSEGVHLFSNTVALGPTVLTVKAVARGASGL